jgi:hypothetical protein
VHADTGQCLVSPVHAGGAENALRDTRTHQAVPLSEGEAAGGAIECWSASTASATCRTG